MCELYKKNSKRNENKEGKTVHNELKKVDFNRTTLYCLLQRLKSTFYEIFSSGASWVSEIFFSQKMLISKWAFFGVLAHNVQYYIPIFR